MAFKKTPGSVSKRAAAAKRAATYADCRRTIWGRCKGHCELCGCALGFESMHSHHRLLRSAGGKDCPSNLLALCYRDHMHTIHAHPTRAMENGWIISRYEKFSPAEVPVVLKAGTFLLDSQGGTVVFVAQHDVPL